MGRKPKRRFTGPAAWELEEFRRFLGPVATGLSDTEVAQLYHQMHEMAKLLLDLYLINQGGSELDENI